MMERKCLTSPRYQLQVFARLFRSQAFERNNLEHPTRYRKIFIASKALYWSFFGVHTHFSPKDLQKVSWREAGLAWALSGLKKTK